MSKLRLVTNELNEKILSERNAALLAFTLRANATSETHVLGFYAVEQLYVLFPKGFTESITCEEATTRFPTLKFLPTCLG